MVIICKSKYIVHNYYFLPTIIDNWRKLMSRPTFGILKKPCITKKKLKIRIYVAIHVLEPSCSWRSKSISFVIRTVPWLRTLNNWIRSIYNVQFFQLHVRGSELLYIKCVQQSMWYTYRAKDMPTTKGKY